VFCCFVFAREGYNKHCFGSMDYVIRQLTREDEPILWEMLYYGLSSTGTRERPPPDVIRRPEIARYVEGWGRVGDTGFVAHDKKNRALLGAAWLRQPPGKSSSPELALAVKPEHRRHGIGTALLTQLVRANPDHSTISVSFVAGKPVLRLYERFGFKVVEQRPDAVVMHRPV
jgi:GNAT superfamily N-acetyltransferase